MKQEKSLNNAKNFLLKKKNGFLSLIYPLNEQQERL